MLNFNGIYAATIVPMDHEGKINKSLLIDHIMQLSKVQGMTGLLINGHAGENYILSQEGQKIIEEKGGLPSINNKEIRQMLNAKPIRLDTGLLVYLDNLKRKNFLREWNAALLQ